MSNRPPFSFDAPFVARDRFLFAGEWIEKGARFDWQERGCTKQQVLNLWQCAILDNEAAPSTGPEQSSPAPIARVTPTPKPAKPPRSSARS